MALNIHSDKVGPARVFELEGALDSTTSDKLDARVQTALDAGESFLIFDLARLSYVSSAGLRVFMLARHRLQDRGKVRFSGLNQDVHRVFDVVGVSPRVEIYETVTAALVGPPAPPSGGTS